MTSTGIAELWRVAVRASLGGGTWPDDAINAALALMAAGDERPAVVEVAILAPRTTARDALDAVRALLAQEGIPILGPEASGLDRLRLFANAFLHGGISANEFGPSWWAELPAYDLQSEEQTRVTAALDSWETEADIAARAPLVDALREEVIGWLAAPHGA